MGLRWGIPRSRPLGYEPSALPLSYTAERGRDTAGIGLGGTWALGGPGITNCAARRRIYQFGIATGTGRDVGCDSYVSDPLPCVLLPGEVHRPRDRPVQHPVRLVSGTPYGGQSPTALARRHLSQSPFRTHTGFRVPAVPPRIELSEGSPYHVHLFDPRRSVECAWYRPECASRFSWAGNEKPPHGWLVGEFPRASIHRAAGRTCVS